MKQMIEVDELNKLLEEFKRKSKKRESFEKFITRTKADDDRIVQWVDDIGILTKGDFENYYSKDFIEKNFDDLAHAWFNGLQGQIDFGMVLECVKDVITEYLPNSEVLKILKNNKNKPKVKIFIGEQDQQYKELGYLDYFDYLKETADDDDYTMEELEECLFEKAVVEALNITGEK